RSPDTTPRRYGSLPPTGRGCSRGRDQECSAVFLLAWGEGIGVRRDTCARCGDRSRVVAGLPLIQGPDGNDPPSNESSTPNSRPKGLEVEDLAGGWKSERDSRLVSGPLLYPRHCQGARHLSEYGAQVPAQPRTAAEQAAAAPAVEAGPVP